MASGMLDPHYFMGRAEILGWINDTLSLRLQKVEDTHNGAVACQLLDVLHAGAVPLKKVDYNAKNEYDMISNYKVLQDVFTKLKVDKYIEVTKLTKGRPLDNMEFMQWFKAYWDQVTNCQPTGSDYDGPSRRAQCKTGDVKGGMGQPAGPGKTISQGARATPSSAAVVSAPMRKAQASGGAAASQRPSVTGSESSEQVEKLSAQLADLRAKAEGFEKEKDFYYSKLRDVELLCQTPKISDERVMKRVQEILYAATAEDGARLVKEIQLEFCGREYTEEEIPDAELA